MSGYITVLPEALTLANTSQLLDLGTKYTDSMGNEYVYFKATAGVLQGDCVYQYTFAANLIYEGWKDQSADCPLVAGVAMATIATGSFGWAQVRGYNANVREDAATALLNSLIGHTTDGEADTMADTEEHLVFAHVVEGTTTFEDDNGDTLDCCGAVLHRCLWG